MGREKIKMKKIDDTSARQVTFSKRRQGLVKKAQELAVLCEAEVAVMVTSPTGRPYQYSSSNIEETLHKFALALGAERQPVSFQEESRNHANLSRGAQDKISFLRRIKTQYLQHFTLEELDQQEMKLEAIIKYVTAKKEVLMNEVPAPHVQDIQTTDTSGIQSGETSCSAQETLGTIKMNPTGDVFPHSQTQSIAQPGATNYLERWIPPPADVYKVNFAGTSFQNVNASGIRVGVVVRNWGGDFMAALAKFFPKIFNVNTASWMAAKCAIEFAVDYYFTHIVLEGDNPDTIKGLQNTYEDDSRASTIIMQEAKGYMMQLGSCFFSHVQTSGNTAAHMVAQYARNDGDELVWLMKEPDFLVDILLADSVQMNY